MSFVAGGEGLPGVNEEERARDAYGRKGHAHALVAVAAPVRKALFCFPAPFERAKARVRELLCIDINLYIGTLMSLIHAHGASRVHIFVCARARGAFSLDTRTS